MQSYQYNFRQANPVLIRNFVSMIFYEERINGFVEELAKSIEILSFEKVNDVYKIDTNKYLIYIYLPYSQRIENESASVLHIDIDQLVSSQAKIVRRIKVLYGLGDRIYARQTVVARIDKSVSMSFLEEHHVNIAVAGKYRYGLFYKGELVSIAVFSGGRLMRDEKVGYRSFELIRFCHKADLLVVGGLSKLLKAFIKDFNPQDIMTYADLDWTTESSLGKIGFDIIERTAPQQFFVENNVRKSLLERQKEEGYLVTNRGSLKLKLRV